MADAFYIEILVNGDGRVKVVEADYPRKSKAPSSMLNAGSVLIAYRIKVEDRDIANAILFSVRRALKVKATSGWLPIDAEAAKRALLEAVLQADESANPATVVAGRSHLRLSPEAGRRLREAASSLNISEGDALNWVVTAYCSQLVPKNRAATFKPTDASEVAHKLLEALKAHPKRTLPRSVLARKRHFSNISEDMLQAAIDRLKSAGEIVENGKSLMLNTDIKRRSATS